MAGCLALKGRVVHCCAVVCFVGDGAEYDVWNLVQGTAFVPVRVVSLVFTYSFVDFFFLLFLDYRRFTISCSRLTQWRAASLSKVG